MPFDPKLTWTEECLQQGVVTLLGITCVVKNLLQPLPAIIAICALGMLIFAGVRYTNAGADAKSISSAQQAFLFAIIGLLLLPIAWLLLIIIERFTGAQVTQFGSTLP